MRRLSDLNVIVNQDHEVREVNRLAPGNLIQQRYTLLILLFKDDPIVIHQPSLEAFLIHASSAGLQFVPELRVLDKIGKDAQLGQKPSSTDLFQSLVPLIDCLNVVFSPAVGGDYFEAWLSCFRNLIHSSG